MKTVLFQRRVVTLLLVMLTAPAMALWAQEMNEKFAWTTQLFLNELKEQTEQPTNSQRRTPARRMPEGPEAQGQDRLIASPDTVDGVAYIPCFIHLKDVGDLGEMSSLGVEIEETFDELHFVTARVPVEQLELLAAVNNVTRIKVAQLMRPLSDAARQLTNVDDLLTLSSEAQALGVSDQWDGTGVVLGIIDTGIDFQHVAFKDKDGNSRIKGAYVYDGNSAEEYTSITSTAPTTDDSTEDHGTHTATTAGGSSVIVSGTDITVTDDHANAIYGGMAPGADLYLAGIKGLKDTYLTNALKNMVDYADSVGKPLVVSNSWGSGFGPRDGTGEWATLVGEYFGDSHPNRIILFAASNDASHTKDNEGGGFFVKKSAASASSPLGTILRSDYYGDYDGGHYYHSRIAVAWSSAALNCNIHVLNSATGEVLQSWTVSSTTSTFNELSTYYSGTLRVTKGSDNGKYYLQVSASKLESHSVTETNLNNKTYYTSNYTLAIEVYPASESADVNMWSGNYSYFTDHLTTEGYTWTAGTDDMCVSDETTIPDAISVGAYMSKTKWPNYEDKWYHYVSSNEQGDIARFSSYATAEQSPTGEAYPWITAPGAMVVAGVNHFHTAEVDDNSYFSEGHKSRLVVNNADNPYGAMQGTSMATPVAAGIVALWLQAARSVNKNLTVNDVKDIMAQTAINDNYTVTGTNASHFGYGKIDALAGIQYILQMTDEPVSNQVTLSNSGNNANVIAAAATKAGQYDVTLKDRTLWKDGAWNTLTLPFDVTVSGSVLDGADVRTLDNASLSADGTLTLNFTEEGAVSTMVAGTPYIIKWASGSNIVEPTFSNVTIDATIRNKSCELGDGKSLLFCGSNKTLTFGNTDRSILFLGNSNTLYYPLANASIGAQRAYFKLVGITMGDPSTTDTPDEVRTFAMNFGNRESGISELPTPGSQASTLHSGWYTLDGRKTVNGTSANHQWPKGIYIKNGRKIVIK